LAGARQFDASAVPLISDKARQTLIDYVRRPDHKALAIAGGYLGVADAAPDVEAAKQEALRRCNARSAKPCQRSAAGQAVVWTDDSLPLPAAEDLRTEPLDSTLVPDEVPLISAIRRQRLATAYLKRPDHRAVALTLERDLVITDRRSQAE